MKELKPIHCLNCLPFNEFESRYVVGSIAREVFEKHTVYAAEINGESVEIVCYRLTKEQMSKKKYFFTEKELEENV